ncbi:MAG: STAS domain-containing protein [Clostridiales bacterium]|jgi:anti-anti-sigma factor|nr:STAS domain-containing protein [Clostridiales bacterium]
MELNKKQDGDSTFIEIKGKLDIKSSKELEKILEESISEKNKEIKINLENLTSISSAALRMLVATQKKMHKQQMELLLINLSSSIREVFDITGFSGLLNV